MSYINSQRQRFGERMHCDLCGPLPSSGQLSIDKLAKLFYQEWTAKLHAELPRSPDQPRSLHLRGGMDYLPSSLDYRMDDLDVSLEMRSQIIAKRNWRHKHEVIVQLAYITAKYGRQAADMETNLIISQNTISSLEAFRSFNWDRSQNLNVSISERRKAQSNYDRLTFEVTQLRRETTIKHFEAYDVRGLQNATDTMWDILTEFHFTHSCLTLDDFTS